jgi:hypothetical protein
MRRGGGLLAALLLCAATAAAVRATSPGGFPNQLALTPPRGWRSWIAFQHAADQSKMEAAIGALHKRRPLGESGKLVSLQDLGYADVALDGGWARCEGVNGSYHDEKGQLLINATKFPSFAAMNDRAHAVGLTSSWYLNCDQCGKTENLTERARSQTAGTRRTLRRPHDCASTELSLTRSRAGRTGTLRSGPSRSTRPTGP